MLSSPSLRIPHSFLLSTHLQPVPKKPIENRKPHKNSIKIQFVLKEAVKISSFQPNLQDPDVELFNSMLSERFEPKAMSSLVKSCTSLREVKSVHAASIRALKSKVTHVGNNLISGYLRFSSLDDALKLFDEMPDGSVVAWTLILNGYLKLGLDSEAVNMFMELIESSVRANGLTFVCMLKSCSNLLDYELGTQIHACIVKGKWRNLIVDSALVHFYTQCGDLFSASRVFEGMRKWDVVSWTTMITSYAQHGHSDKALATFSRMQTHGCRPNKFTLCGVLKACGEAKALRFGRQLHGSLVKQMFEEDVVAGSSLVTMYVKCGEISDARLVFDLMPRRNTVTWSSMISGYARNGLGEEAISLFGWMKKFRVSTNSQTIVAILSACGSLGSLSLGKQVHCQTLKKIAERNIHIDTTLIWLYCKCRQFTYAARILESMPERDAISWTAMISGHNTLDDTSDSLRFLNKMLWEGVKPTPYTYSSAFKACKKREQVQYGKLIHGSASKMRAMSNVFVSTALIDMYVRCGCIKDAEEVFEAMPERNLVSWKAMIIGCAERGYCWEALKFMYRMQDEGFHVDNFIRSTVLNSCGDFQWEKQYPVNTHCL